MSATYAIVEPIELQNLLVAIEELKGKIEALSNEPQKEVVYNNKTLTELLDVSERTLKKYRDTGKLAYTQVYDKFWYKKKDVDDFLKKHRFDTF